MCLASCLFADSVTTVGANDFYFAVIEWSVKASHILYNASLVLFKQGPKPVWNRSLSLLPCSGPAAMLGRAEDWSVLLRQGTANFRLDCSKCQAVSPCGFRNIWKYKIRIIKRLPKRRMCARVSSYHMSICLCASGLPTRHNPGVDMPSSTN